MYNEDDADSWRPSFRLPCLHGIPWNLLIYAAAIVSGWRLGLMLRSMKRRLETLEAILLDNPPRR